jgi:hypothetical protein
MVKRPDKFNLTEETNNLAQKLAELIGKDVKVFDEREAKALAELAEMQIRSPGALEAWIKLYDTTQSMGKLGTTLKNTVAWFIYMGAAFIAFKAGVINAIVSIVKDTVK